MSTVTRTFHMCLDIRGALNQPVSKLKYLFKDNDGKSVSGEIAREHLYGLLASGKKVLPIGDPCEGFSYETGCPGHVCEKGGDL